MKYFCYLKLVKFQTSSNLKVSAYIYYISILDNTDLFVNGKYMAGPSFPSGAYPGYFTYPCLSAVDDNTGIIMFGLYNSVTYTQVRSYNFTSRTWKQLKDSPIKRKLAVCQKVTLANQTTVIFVIGTILTFK